MTIITALTSPEVKKVVALHDRKGRQKHHLFIAEGERCIRTFFDAGSQSETLYVVAEKQDQYAQLIRTASQVQLVSEAVMQKMSCTTTSSGILATFPLPITPSKPSLTPGLVLARIQDPGNMGTLIRTAAAFQVPLVVIVEGCDPYSPKVVQASAGALALVPIIQVSWEHLCQNKKGIPLAALVVAGGEAPQKSAIKRSLVVVGSEAHGIPAAWLAACNTRITLPMPGTTESLNAAIAGAIALYMGYHA